MLSPAARFDAGTALEPAGDGRYRGRVDRGWFVVSGPNGGLLAALATRALADAVPAPPRSLSLHYLEAPAEGPVDVTCEVVRRGRTTSFARLSFEQEGRPVVLGLAACAEPRADQPEWSDARMPDVPRPDDLPPAERPEGLPPYFDQYQMRWVPPDPAARPIRVAAWMRAADPRPADDILLAAMTDALMPPAFLRLRGERPFVPTMDLTVHWRAPAPPGDHPWVLGVFTSRVGAGGVCDEDGELWSEDGTLLAHSRQLAIVRRPRG